MGKLRNVAFLYVAYLQFSIFGQQKDLLSLTLKEESHDTFAF